ncbi:MAG: hypothetical protein JWO45_1720 [Spartobacteria bacterium]|nr:hypothetical protein [Spartobacteria bacterium]
MTRSQRILQRVGLDQVAPTVRRWLIGIIGITIVLIGLLMIFLPGPGSLVIFAGLGVLATEFVWARRVINRARDAVKKVGRTMKGTTKS